MTENETKPQHLIPWCCPKCGTDCSGSEGSTRDSGDCIGHPLKCKCGREFIHWENITYDPCCVEVDGVKYEYPESSKNANVSSLVHEYQDIAGEFADIMDTPVDDIVSRLVKNHDWTQEGAAQVMELVTKYGAFILRNALALAIALNIEDGTEEL